MAEEFVFPASFSQQRLWFLEQIESGSSIYNISAAARLKGPLDLQALQRGLQQIVNRHEALRTTFRTHQGQPVQVVHPTLEVRLDQEDGQGESAHPQTAQEWANRQAPRSLDLEAGPLLRCSLLRFGERDHVLALVVHHIVFDGWSMGIFLRELSALYNAGLGIDEPGLPQLPVQYVDYTDWQRQWLQSEVLQEHVDFWKEYLKGAPSALELPTDRVRPKIQTYQGESLAIAWDADRSARLKRFCRREAVSPFMALTAAFLTLLHRLTGQVDLVVGTPVANRDQEEIQNLIGFFVNSLVLRVQVDGDPTFRQLLQRVQMAASKAYAHQEIPFEKLVEELRPPRDLGRNPIYQITFGLLDEMRPLLGLEGIEATPLAADSGTAKFDLSLLLQETSQGLAGTLEYSTSLFEAATMGRFLAQFQMLLEAALARPDSAVGALDVLPAAQRHQVLREWSSGRNQGREFPLAPALFEEQARLRPDAPAVVQCEAVLSFGELNRRANQLANGLAARGVGGGSPVGVFTQRSPDLILALWGILKAGGAYLPLDPAYPSERIRFLVQDSGAPLILSQEALRDRLPSGWHSSLMLDSGWESLAGLPGQDAARPAARQELAYLIYTSGSTGRPKGVMISHQAFSAYTRLAAAEYRLGPGERMLQFCSISFDISIEEIVPALTHGAALVLRTDEMLDSIRVFLRCTAEWALTAMSLPTAYWHEIVDRMAAESLQLPGALRLVIIAGERAIPERLALWRERVEGRPRLINTYGLTEATVISTFCDLGEGGDQRDQREVPVGRPVPGVQLYLLDRRLQPVPAGTPGELYVGGALLGRGYHNRPGLTAQRFVPNPLADGRGQRLYRTGDFARHRPNGNLEFLGRMDHQVKLSGYRIELGEIEARLQEHPAIEKAVVLARQDRPGQLRLAAYLVAQPQQQGEEGAAMPSAAQLRDFLRQRLPEYMVPAAYVELAELPLTPNGKVDRQILPAPGLPLSADSPEAAPRDGLERLIAAAWQESLGLESVGRDDNFFDLGGHSLLMVQVQGQLRDSLKREVSMLSMFEHPTVSSLAAFLGDKKEEAPSAKQASLQRVRQQQALRESWMDRSRKRMPRL